MPDADILAAAAAIAAQPIWHPTGRVAAANAAGVDVRGLAHCARLGDRVLLGCPSGTVPAEIVSPGSLLSRGLSWAAIPPSSNVPATLPATAWVFPEPEKT